MDLIKSDLLGSAGDILDVLERLRNEMNTLREEWAALDFPKEEFEEYVQQNAGQRFGVNPF